MCMGLREEEGPIICQNLDTKRWVKRPSSITRLDPNTHQPKQSPLKNHSHSDKRPAHQKSTPLPKMIRLLLRSPSPKTLTLTLISPFSTHHRPNKHHKRKPQPPPFNQSDLDNAISTLPSRFTPSDLTHLLSLTPNPYLCFHLFNWAQTHPRFKPDPALFHLTIKKLGRARLVPELNSVASLALSSLPPSLPLFNTIIYFFAESRALSKSIYVYKLMLKSPDPNARPNIVTYNLLFNALLGKGSNSYIHHLYMDTIRSLFRQMVDSGVKPDLTALNFVVRGYVNSMHLNDALRVFHQFTSVYGMEPDENTYGYLVHGLCAQGRTKNAMELYGEMRGKGMGLGERAGNSLVSALAMGGEVEESVRVLWEVVEMGRVVELITCRTVAEVVARVKGKEAAVEVVGMMREREVLDGRVWRELVNWIEDGCGFGNLELIR